MSVISNVAFINVICKVVLSNVFISIAIMSSLFIAFN
jgi:hypothetical protein